MIQDVFKLKKKSWHMSLMTWIWGYKYYDFPNMCSYFWLSILNIIIAPLVVLGRGFIMVMVALDNYSTKYRRQCEERELQWYKDQLESIKKNPEGKLAKKVLNAKINYYLSDRYKISGRMNRLIDKLYWLDMDLANEIRDKAWDIAQEKRKEKRKEQMAASDKPKSTRQTIGENTVLIKKVVKVLVVGLTVVMLYLLFLLTKWMITLNWAHILYVTGVAILKFLVGMVITALLIVVIIGIGKLVKFLYCNYAQYCIPCEERRESIATLFLSIGKGIIFPFVWIWQGLVVLWQVLKALKEDNCPAIDWED
jgi:hypothetical protein